MVNRFRGGGGGGQSGTFDARTILNVTKRIRVNKLRKQGGAGGLSLVSPSRGGLWTKRGLGLRRPTAVAAPVKTLVNFTVVSQVPNAPQRQFTAQRAQIGGRGGITRLTRTIDNSRVTMAGGNMSKTIVNTKSKRPVGLTTARHPLSRDADYGVPTIVRRGANTAGSLLTARAGRQIASGRTGPSAMFITAMREAQEDHTPYEPADVSMEMEDVQSPVRMAPARTRLGPPPQQQTASTARGVRVLITNLASSVTNDDVEELCSSVNGLVQSRLIEPGLAEAIYSTRRSAEEAINLYDKRELDGVPMRLQMTQPQQPKTSLPVKKQPDEGSLPALRQKLKTNPTKQQDMGVDRDLITSALFPQKKGSDSSGVTFTVKI